MIYLVKKLKYDWRKLKRDIRAHYVNRNAFYFTKIGMLIQERLCIISQIATYKISTRWKLVKKKFIKISYSTVMHSPNLITKKDYLCPIDFSC